MYPVFRFIDWMLGENAAYAEIGISPMFRRVYYKEA